MMTRHRLALVLSSGSVFAYGFFLWLWDWRQSLHGFIDNFGMEG